MDTLKAVLRTLASAALITFAWSTVATAQVGSGQPGVAAFLSAVNSSADELKALNAEKSLCTHDIHMVSMEKISNAGNAATIARSIAKNAAQISALRDALKSNETVMSVLTAAGVSIGQVVALDVEPGTGIHIYYQ